MRGAVKGIPKGETYHKYGGAARKIEIGEIEKHGAFIRIPLGQIPTGESLFEGRFVYTIKTNPFRRDMGKQGII